MLIRSEWGGSGWKERKGAGLWLKEEEGGGPSGWKKRKGAGLWLEEDEGGGASGWKKGKGAGPLVGRRGRGRGLWLEERSLNTHRTPKSSHSSGALIRSGCDRHRPGALRRTNRKRRHWASVRRWSGRSQRRHWASVRRWSGRSQSSPMGRFSFQDGSLTQRITKVDERAAVAAEELRKTVSSHVKTALEQKETADVHPVRPPADRRGVSTMSPHTQHQLVAAARDYSPPDNIHRHRPKKQHHEALWGVRGPSGSRASLQ
ncbi:hypothetical protein EYF80_057353 [Liparis tanakae]|uniref:Uncharacterized protein n=1 Tax=Liparis tanakae TaxID=230148 RepID=A0A4Z2EU81_9TELE|nr:hypothetical protein EYF80_057353 [Liparis tanakae]